LIAAERRRESAGIEEILLSAISVIELEHGLWRANTPDLVRRRRLYLDGVFYAIPVQPFTKEMGQLAGRIDAEARRAGVVIPHLECAPLRNDPGPQRRATQYRR
jgi:predicted nucleic acid-binding protein